MSDERESVEARNVSMYPRHWRAVDEYAREKSDYKVSAALRRIIEEWAALKGCELSLDANGNGA